MYPDRKTALAALELAGEMNPGPWTDHSRHVAEAAEIIAAACGLDSEKAYVLGLLHDIGRRTGIAANRHITDGYDYAMSLGWDEVARVCMTHSFPIQDVDINLSKRDYRPGQYEFAKEYIAALEYDDYDRLIILCDSLADKDGFCILEKRFIDTSRRYGAYPFSVDRWNKTFAFKEGFERIIGASVYTLLPGIENCIYT